MAEQEYFGKKTELTYCSVTYAIGGFYVELYTDQMPIISSYETIVIEFGVNANSYMHMTIIYEPCYEYPRIYYFPIHSTFKYDDFFYFQLYRGANCENQLEGGELFYNPLKMIPEISYYCDEKNPPSFTVSFDNMDSEASLFLQAKLRLVSEEDTDQSWISVQAPGASVTAPVFMDSFDNIIFENKKEVLPGIVYYFHLNMWLCVPRKYNTFLEYEDGYLIHSEKIELTYYYNEKLTAYSHSSEYYYNNDFEYETDAYFILPDNTMMFEWNPAVEKGKRFNITADEWMRFCKHISNKSVLLNQGEYHPEDAFEITKDAVFYADIFNDARDYIYSLKGYTLESYAVSKGDFVTADNINAIVLDINKIYKEY